MSIHPVTPLGRLPASDRNNVFLYVSDDSLLTLTRLAFSFLSARWLQWRRSSTSSPITSGSYPSVSFALLLSECAYPDLRCFIQWMLLVIMQLTVPARLELVALQWSNEQNSRLRNLNRIHLLTRSEQMRERNR